jgi:hypothetical protein
MSTEPEIDNLKSEIEKLKGEIRDDRKLLRKVERTLAEIDRASGLSDEHADVLAAVRILLEGKPRKSLEDLMTAAGEISGKRDLGDVLAGGEESETKEWPEVKETKRDWPGA